MQLSTCNSRPCKKNTNCQREGIASLRATAWHVTHELPGASMQTRRVKACGLQTARDRACTSYLQQQSMRGQKAGHASSGKAGYATTHAGHRQKIPHWMQDTTSQLMNTFFRSQHQAAALHVRHRAAHLPLFNTPHWPCLPREHWQAKQAVGRHQAGPPP